MVQERFKIIILLFLSLADGKQIDVGVDLNLQFPAGWEQAKEIKFAQGFTSPAPRDYVGSRSFSYTRSPCYI